MKPVVSFFARAHGTHNHLRCFRRHTSNAIRTSPLIPGKYDIVVDVNGNGVYDDGVDALDDKDVQVTAGFFVIPEYLFGTILALIGCFAAFGIFRFRRTK